MNVVDIFKNPLPMIAASTAIALSIYLLSERLESRTPRPRPTLKKAVDILTPISRRVVFAIALLWALSVYVYASYSFSEPMPSIAFMTRIYGLSALAWLFAVLLIGVLRVYFPKLLVHPLLLHASRGFGLSTFLFVCLHALCAFFANLDGKLNAALFLSSRHQAALVFSSAAFCILLLMAGTSVDRVISWMTFPRWKKLHRFVHVAAILVLFHAFLIGSHFTVVAEPLPLIIIGTALTLLLLEAGAIYKKTQSASAKKGSRRREQTAAALILLVCAGIFTATMALRSSYDPHAGHTMSYSDQYIIEVSPSPAQFAAGQSIQLSIRVKDKQSAQLWTDYTVINEKLLHLIIISEDMQHYEHLHPDYLGSGEFVTRYTPPLESTYYLYAEFAPRDTTEALARAVIKTSNAPVASGGLMLEETSRSQPSERYTVELKSENAFLPNRTYQLSFFVKDSESGASITSFEPYLGVSGHLAIVHEDKQTYLHVHPTTKTNQTAEKSIDFTTQFPKPGMYRVYVQFKHEGRLQSAAFTVSVQ